MKNKFFTYCLLVISIMVMFCSISWAQIITLNDQITNEKIANGVDLQKIKRFTNEGWQEIRVLKIDNTEPTLELKTAYNRADIKQLETVPNLVKSNGLIAGINGSFFSWLKDRNEAYLDGPFVRNSLITSATSSYNQYRDAMASFSITNDKTVDYSYWKVKMKIIAQNGNELKVDNYNKYTSSSFNDVTIFDKRWSKTSVGTFDSWPDILEVVVENGIVVEMRKGQPAVKLPDSGYVLITRGDDAKFIEDNVNVGESIKFDITSNPDWNNLKLSVAGSAMLVKDGKIPSPFSFDIPGKHPRTSVGTSQDGKMIYFVTVDGRQERSVGMTLYEMAELMQEVGCYNAINMDGGSSTTMAVRKPGTDSINVVSSPFNDYANGISTALGVQINMYTGELAQLIIEPQVKKVMVNNSISLKVGGVDQYYNTVDISGYTTSWKVSGVAGEVKNNRFYPKSSGIATITANINNIEESTTVEAIEAPTLLKINSQIIRLGIGEKFTFEVSGATKDGFTTKFNNSELSWKLNGDLGSITNGVFVAKNIGTGYVEVTKGDLKAYCAVVTAKTETVVIDNFEKLNGTFKADPVDIGGSYAISTKFKKDGKASGKLTYNFTKVDGNRFANLVFPNGGIVINKGTASIGIDANNNHVNSTALRAEIYDAKGNRQFIDFAKTMTWIGWKYCEANIGNILLPATLTALYVVQTNPVPDFGEIYLDNLIFKGYMFADIDVNEILPQGAIFKDSELEDTATSNSAINANILDKVAFIDIVKEPKNLLDKMIFKNIIQQSNASYKTIISSNKTVSNLLPDINSDIKNTHSGYWTYNSNGTKLICLDNSNGSIRKTDYKQWLRLKEDLQSNDINNFVVVLSEPINTFDDIQEMNLLKTTLSNAYSLNHKKIWVISKTNNQKVYYEDGIKYIEYQSLDTQGVLVNNSSSLYNLVLNIKENDISYNFDKIFQ